MDNKEKWKDVIKICCCSWLLCTVFIEKHSDVLLIYLGSQIKLMYVGL